jgi:polyhydroxyalkanoate synthesis regulator phasin
MVAANVEGVVERTGRENLLRDFVRFSWRATRGLASAAEAEGNDLVRRMVDVGRLSPDEGDRLLATLRSRMNVSRQVFERRVDLSVRKAVEKMQEISERELARLAAQVGELEKRLERMATAKSGR